MKEKILHTATDLFLTIGFKSVTMDDIAVEMAISKKTIYTFYKNKAALIEASVYSVFEMITTGINQICIVDNNPIAELFIIKDFVLKNLKNEKTSPIFQLKKYYPKLYAQLQKEQLGVMQDCVNQNIEKGIKLGLLKKDLNIDFIGRIYFSGINAIKDDDLFPKENTTMEQLMNDFLNYHISAIATEKGIEELKKQIKIKSL